MIPGDAIDTMLDRSIVLGYGDIGLRARRLLATWPEDPPRIDGKVVLVTGAASGIGLSAARRFAQLGARVLAVARTPQRARDAARQITAVVPGADVDPHGCDVSSTRAVRELAARVVEVEKRLDVLVNNAGTMPAQRRCSPEGHELMFATHVLGPFALTWWLRGLLARSAPARVINVSSGGMYAQRLPRGDLQSGDTRYSPKKLYARTKREQVVISELWACELEAHGVVVHSMHPGWVDTKGVRKWLPLFRAVTGPILRTPEQGADTIVWLGAAQGALARSGLFWHDRRPRPTHYAVGAPDDDPHDRRRLWDLCRSLVAACLGESERRLWEVGAGEPPEPAVRLCQHELQVADAPFGEARLAVGEIQRPEALEGLVVADFRKLGAVCVEPLPPARERRHVVRRQVVQVRDLEVGVKRQIVRQRRQAGKRAARKDPLLDE